MRALEGSLDLSGKLESFKKKNTDCDDRNSSIVTPNKFFFFLNRKECRKQDPGTLVHFFFVFCTKQKDFLLDCRAIISDANFLPKAHATTPRKKAEIPGNREFDLRRPSSCPFFEKNFCCLIFFVTRQKKR